MRAPGHLLRTQSNSHAELHGPIAAPTFISVVCFTSAPDDSDHRHLWPLIQNNGHRALLIKRELAMILGSVRLPQ